MTIQQIKSKLSILTVLSHYGLEMDRNSMLCCPFHEDGKASMKVYEETNTVYCFAGSCKVSNLDTIDFIMQMDGSSKHEAIKKAGQMASEIAEAPKVKKTKEARRIRSKTSIAISRLLRLIKKRRNIVKVEGWLGRCWRSATRAAKLPTAGPEAASSSH
jgi:DNA primase